MAPIKFEDHIKETLSVRAVSDGTPYTVGSTQGIHPHTDYEYDEEIKILVSPQESIYMDFELPKDLENEWGAVIETLNFKLRLMTWDRTEKECWATYSVELLGYI